MQDEAFSTNGGGDDVDGILPFLTQALCWARFKRRILHAPNQI